MTKPRSNLAIANRIDATVAATRIYELMREEENDKWVTLPTSEPWMIIGGLREVVISRELMREWLDAILAAELSRWWRTCWMRRRVGDIETVLGLTHDPRSHEALEAARRGDDAWKTYCNSEPSKSSAPIAIEICAAPQ